MIVAIQRVSEALVKISGDIHGSIQSGLLVLLGIENADTVEDIEWLVSKIIKLRIFADQNGVMNLSLEDVEGDILVISQFTLHASTKKGNRPSYIKAAKPEIAIPLYEEFIAQINSKLDRPAKTGKFGADMQVQLINDGPVTIIIDTKNKT